MMGTDGAFMPPNTHDARSLAAARRFPAEWARCVNASGKEAQKQRQKLRQRAEIMDQAERERA